MGVPAEAGPLSTAWIRLVAPIRRRQRCRGYRGIWGSDLLWSQSTLGTRSEGDVWQCQESGAYHLDPKWQSQLRKKPFLADQVTSKYSGGYQSFRSHVEETDKTKVSLFRATSLLWANSPRMVPNPPNSSTHSTPLEHDFNQAYASSSPRGLCL